MYQKGDYINYGGHGICQIEDIRAMDFKTGSGKRDYYILHPIRQDGTVFYLPADSSDTRSRRLLTREEIDGILTGSVPLSSSRSSPAGISVSWCCWQDACIFSSGSAPCPPPNGRPCTRSST